MDYRGLGAAADQGRRPRPLARVRVGLTRSRRSRIFVPAEGGNNSVVECDLAKVEVAGSNPVSRSMTSLATRARHDTPDKPPATRARGLSPCPALPGRSPARGASTPRRKLHASCRTRAPPGPQSIATTSKRSGDSEQAVAGGVDARRPHMRWRFSGVTASIAATVRGARCALLHLDEDERRAVARDHVDLAAPAAEVAVDDPQPSLLEVRAGEVLPGLPGTRARGSAHSRPAPRQRVPLGVSSSTTPSASSALRAASARREVAGLARRPAARRTAPAPRATGGPPPRPAAARRRRRPSRRARANARRARPRQRPSASRLFAQLTRPWTAASASGVLRSSPSAASNAVAAAAPRPLRRDRPAASALGRHLVEPLREPVDPLQRRRRLRQPLETEVERLAVVRAREQVADRLGPVPAARRCPGS